MMQDFYRPMLELCALLPGATLCLLPMRGYLKHGPRRTALYAALLLLPFCFLGGLLCAALSWSPETLMVMALPLLGLLYVRWVQLPPGRSVNIFISVTGVFSCLYVLSIVLDSLFRERNILPYFTWQAGLCYNALCWVFTIAAAPFAVRRVPFLFESQHVSARSSWWLFSALPALFLVLNTLLRPADYANLRLGRMMLGYVSVEILYLTMLLLFYLLVFLLARGMDAGNRLKQENQFLQMQAAQYETLRTAIAETRQARHDLRHHLGALSALSDREDWDSLKQYLAQVQASVPTAELNLCDNAAVDGVAGHYAALCQREHVPLRVRLELPHDLPVPEMDVCVVLSNLMENALDASLQLPQGRYIRAEARLHTETLVLLSVENAYAGSVTQEDGVFRSSKRDGEGVGLQSVRRIAEKQGGYCDFTYDGGIFRANVMLRGGKTA